MPKIRKSLSRRYLEAKGCKLTRTSKRSKKCVTPYKSFLYRMGGLDSFRSPKTARSAFKRKCGATDRRRKAYYKNHPRTSLTCDRRMIHRTIRKRKAGKRHKSTKGKLPPGLAA